MLNSLLRKPLPARLVLMIMVSIASGIVFTPFQVLGAGDPFGVPPKGTMPDCGPENRLKLVISVPSKAAYIEVLRNIESLIGDHEVRQWVKFDSFKRAGSEAVD